MESQFIQQNLYWIVPVALFEFIIKPFALWSAARSERKGWFVALFLLNTAGILPAIYLLFLRKKNVAKK